MAVRLSNRDVSILKSLATIIRLQMATVGYFKETNKDLKNMNSVYNKHRVNFEGCNTCKESAVGVLG